MSTKEQSDQILRNCSSELIAYCAGYYGDTPGPSFKGSMERIVNDNFCLAEFFDVVEKSYVVLQHCDTTTTGIFELQDALAALRAKLPKEVL